MFFWKLNYNEICQCTSIFRVINIKHTNKFIGRVSRIFYIIKYNISIIVIHSIEITIFKCLNNDFCIIEDL